MLRSFLIVITISFLFCSLPSAAAVLSYQEGKLPNSSNIHTIIYIDKIGTTPVTGACLEIKDRVITVYGRSGEVSDRDVLLNGQLIKTKMSDDAKHLDAIAYFIDGSLLQKRLRAHQNEIVFIEDGFVSGKIDSFTPDTILINDHGYPRSVKLNTVLSIRSPRVYNLQLDLRTLNNSSETGYQYDVIGSSLKETIPPQMISSESINPKKPDDDLNFDLDPRDLGDDDL